MMGLSRRAALLGVLGAGLPRSAQAQTGAGYNLCGARHFDLKQVTTTAGWMFLMNFSDLWLGHADHRLEINGSGVEYAIFAAQGFRSGQTWARGSTSTHPLPIALHMELEQPAGAPYDSISRLAGVEPGPNLPKATIAALYIGLLPAARRNDVLTVQIYFDEALVAENIHETRDRRKLTFEATTYAFIGFSSLAPRLFTGAVRQMRIVVSSQRLGQRSANYDLGLLPGVKALIDAQYIEMRQEQRREEPCLMYNREGWFW